MTSFRKVVDVFNKLENISSTLKKIEILTQLFNEVDPEEIDKLIYLTEGILHPNYTTDPPIGIAEKVAIKAISKMSGLSEASIKKIIDTYGGVGNAIDKIYKQKKSLKTIDSYFEKGKISDKEKGQRDLSINEIYNAIDEIAHQQGKGATLRKIELLSNLLKKVSEKEAKYILRTILGKLRLGIADMTIINALSIAFTGSKENKELIERKFNIFPDLGKIGEMLAREGLSGLEKLDITVGIPIKMMLAQRAKSIDEIFERMGKKFAAEYKYDGERVQVHKLDDKVLLFSRNTENITHMYPEILDIVKKLNSKTLIIEGEIVAIDPKTGRIKPFQELMRRRRKYDIERMMKEYPIELYLFDILFKDNKSMLKEPYLVRRKLLEEVIMESNLEDDSLLKLAKQKVISTSDDLDTFFEESLDQCEGLMIKSVEDISIYQAGNRGYIWLKLKKSYQSKMIDSVDVAIIGAYMGRGKRGGTYGALLCGVYNDKKEMFQSICKLGSGFSDKDLEGFSELFRDLVMEEKPNNVDVISEKIKPDIWIQPNIVCSVIGDEITLSPDHSAGFGLIKDDAGFAIRFPRFLGFRYDKSINEVTTIKEILEIYEKQTK
ncbi:MAG: ATP-dependent DNA ligase [Candidatus Helarchaeota archaeon]